MEILLNELSLNGQFRNEDEFFDNLDKVLENIKVLEILNFSILKEYSLFNSKVTDNYKFIDFLKIGTDRARKFKSVLAKLAQNPPFWNTEQRHNCLKDKYIFNEVNICGSSLAESSQRDRIILSFNHDNFKYPWCTIYKNSSEINIYNIITKDSFLEYLIEKSLINPLSYCQSKYTYSKLNFDLINEGFGFDSLETPQQIKEFLNSFELFHRGSWEEILKSDGFEFKPYSPSKKDNWFRNTDFKERKIYKFRVSQKYRCFGYRYKEIFFILRFEISHEISDNG